MALSPTDIRNFEFTTQMRGYNKEEVDDFMEQVASALEEAKQENLKLSMQADSLKTQLEGLRQFEDSIKSAAIDARRNADQTLQQARDEAEKIVTEARRKAERLVGDREKLLQELEARTEKADMVKRAYIGKLQDLIESHLEMVKALAQSMPAKDQDEDEPVDDDPDRIQVTDSSEVERDGMNTIGSQPSESEPEAAEEANAASKIVPAEAKEEQQEDPKAEASLPTAPKNESESETPTDRTPTVDNEQAEKDTPVDPELAAALEKYKGSETDEESGPQETETSQDTEEPAGEASPMATNAETPASETTSEPPPGFAKGIVETDSRAEDIPPEFIVKKANEGDPNATDRLDDYVDKNKPNARSQVLDADKPTKQDEAETPDPEKLAEELDAVAAKFEEEMDRAASK